MRVLSKIALGIISLLTIALCVKMLNEPDIFWQLRTGEWILNHGSIPTTDIFSFTYYGDPWNNVKWGSDVIMALFSRMGGPEALIFLQLILLGGIIYFMWLRYKLGLEKPLLSAFLYALFIWLIICSFRFNGRPEMFSHLMTALYIWLIVRHRLRKDRLIFLIIPLQLIWVNLHEGYGVGLVLIGMLLVSEWLENRIAGVEKRSSPILTLGGLLVAAVMVTAIHPMGLKMITYPLNIFGQLSENNFTTELLDFTHGTYWNIHSWLSLLVFIYYLLRVKFFHLFTFHLSHIGQKNKGRIFYLFLLPAFFYLSLKAERNIPFLLIALTPLLAEEGAKMNFFRTAKSFRLLIAMSAGLYLMIISGKWYSEFYPRERFGWAVDYTKNPVNAAEFIAREHVAGKAFSDYFNSSYLLWALQPDFKTFIDMRDLDVFPPVFFQNVYTVYQQPEARTGQGGPTLWELIKEEDSIAYIIMSNRQEFAPFHRYILKEDKTFSAVYTDPMATIYINKMGPNAGLVSESLESGTDIYHPLKLTENHSKRFYNILSRILNPFYNPAGYLDPYQGSAMRQKVYNYLGRNPPQ